MKCDFKYILGLGCQNTGWANLANNQYIQQVKNATSLVNSSFSGIMPIGTVGRPVFRLSYIAQPRLWLKQVRSLFGSYCRAGKEQYLKINHKSQRDFQRGSSLVEYALLIALLSLASIAAMEYMGRSVALRVAIAGCAVEVAGGGSECSHDVENIAGINSNDHAPQ